MRTAVPMLLAALAACGPDAREGGHGSGAPDSAPSSDAPVVDGDISPGMTFVYAHTADELYKIDPDTLALSLVGPFVWSDGAGVMTDLAIDKNGRMIGISFGSVYSVDPMTAHATFLANLGGSFNGLSFVPAAAAGVTGPDDVLIATEGKDGIVYKIDPATGAALPAGQMGGQYSSSGDLVAVDGFGIVQTTPGAPNDILVTLAPLSFMATPIGSTGFGEIYGVGFWKNKVFGFTLAGDFITIDPATGAGTLVQHTDKAWYGAAVTTVAPVIQ